MYNIEENENIIQLEKKNNSDIIAETNTNIGDNTEINKKICTSTCYFGIDDSFSINFTDEQNITKKYNIASKNDIETLKKLIIQKNKTLKKQEGELKKIEMELSKVKRKLSLSEEEKNALKNQYKILETEIKSLKKDKDIKKAKKEDINGVIEEIETKEKQMSGIFKQNKDIFLQEKIDILKVEIEKMKNIKMIFDLTNSSKLSIYELGLLVACWDEIAQKKKEELVESVVYNSNFEQYVLYLKDLYNVCYEFDPELFPINEYKKYIDTVKKRSDFFKTTERKLAEILDIPYNTVNVLEIDNFEDITLNPKTKISDYKEIYKEKFSGEFSEKCKNTKNFLDLNGLSWCYKDYGNYNVLQTKEEKQKSELEKICPEDNTTDFLFVDEYLNESWKKYYLEQDEKIAEIKSNSNKLTEEQEKEIKKLENKKDSYIANKDTPNIIANKNDKNEIISQTKDKDIKNFFLSEEFEAIANDFEIYFSGKETNSVEISA